MSELTTEWVNRHLTPPVPICQRGNRKKLVKTLNPVCGLAPQPRIVPERLGRPRTLRRHAARVAILASCAQRAGNGHRVEAEFALRRRTPARGGRTRPAAEAKNPPGYPSCAGRNVANTLVLTRTRQFAKYWRASDSLPAPKRTSVHHPNPSVSLGPTIGGERQAKECTRREKNYRQSHHVRACYRPGLGSRRRAG